MTYKNIINLSEKEFKRYTGIKKEVFSKMVEIIRKKEKRKKKLGRPTDLTAEDKVLITLEYYREYETMFHIGVKWGVSEAQICRIIKEVEKELIKCKEFHLPGKKILLQTGTGIETIVVDVGEITVERPKKTKKILQWKEKKTYTQGASNSK
jgi:hypothetical protein